jgi:hypothetical protein
MPEGKNGAGADVFREVKREGRRGWCPETESNCRHGDFQFL